MTDRHSEQSEESRLPAYLHALSIPTPFPVGPVNVYLAKDHPVTLIDVGPRTGPARAALEDGLAGYGVRVADVGRLIITHAHEDHYGLAAEVVRASGAQVLTHTANLPWLAADGGANRLAFYGEVMAWAGVPAEVLMGFARQRQGTSSYAEPVVVDRTLADGDVLRLGSEDWQVLHTPGHAGGLICLYQPQRRLLLSSDHLIRDISSNPVLEPPAPGETGRPRRLVQYLAQLRRVAALEVDLALPGHGPPIADHRALIDERLAFHDARAGRILEVMGSAALTAHDIVAVLFPTPDPISTFLAISEVVGHLQWLEVEGRVTHTEEHGVARWQSLSALTPISAFSDSRHADEPT
jgi:glyoxylase-like metal-dependent hydrolase (beta-lactamase superfamily II)